MKIETFNQILERRIELTKKVLVQKGNEYGEQVDRLANFKRLAEEQDCHILEAWFGVAAKHLVSVKQMVKSKQKYPQEVWDEKLGDLINYLCLLEAIVQEEGVYQ